MKPPMTLLPAALFAAIAPFAARSQNISPTAAKPDTTIGAAPDSSAERIFQKVVLNGDPILAEAPMNAMGDCQKSIRSFSNYKLNN
jgi:hypothetical protein